MPLSEVFFRNSLIVDTQINYMKEVNKHCFSTLTPLEKKLLKQILIHKGSYLLDVASNDSGKVITFFLPNFEEKIIKVRDSYSQYKITWEKPDGTFINRIYNSKSYNFFIGFVNNYGWKIINIEELKFYNDSFRSIY